MVAEKVCLSCGEKITGRSDKKFCSDMCRNVYNNELNSDANNLVRNINNILRKNRRLLAEFLDKNEKVKVGKEKMLAKGFSFNYFTHTYQTKTGNTYIFCYEYGYLQMENDQILIVLRKES